MIRTILASAVIAASLTGGAAVMASADQPIHEVPTWMRQSCTTLSSVNCYWPEGSFKPDQGEMYVRRMPGREKMVCVFYVTHPKRDYCQSTR